MTEPQSPDAGAPPAIVPGRACGDCMLCCKLFAIASLDKPMGKWCAHARPGAGCGIYQERPWECRAFHCGWLTDASLGQEWKPDRAKFYINRKPDGNVEILVDPGAPGAWRSERYYPTIKIFAARLRQHGATLSIVIGHRIIVVLPERDIDVGVVPDDHAVRVGPRTINGKTEITAWSEPIQPVQALDIPND